MTNFEWMLKYGNKTLADLIDGKWNCLYCAYALECSKSPSRCKGCEDGTIEWLLAERNYDWKKEVLTRNDIKRAMNAAYGRRILSEGDWYTTHGKMLRWLYESYKQSGFTEEQAMRLVTELAKNCFEHLEAILKEKEK